MYITWTIMLTKGPLVGEANVDTVTAAADAVEQAARDALGPGYTDLHAQGMRKLRVAILSGKRSWISSGVWVEIEE
ncbi:hypothetical protein ACFWPU_01205 [Streptomyces sp. NPDC058471]|uniref:hypothetical protein n=1 Tax=Streptomyces sp. NPDC058471 TaxID=3346516 RepID=UPI00365D40C2